MPVYPLTQWKIAELLGKSSSFPSSVRCSNFHFSMLVVDRLNLSRVVTIRLLTRSLSKIRIVLKIKITDLFII